MAFIKDIKWLNVLFELLLILAIFLLTRYRTLQLLLLIVALTRYYFLYQCDTSKKEMENDLNDPLLSPVEEADIQEKMKLLALQNQINPHFLYNTLEGIRSEALLGDGASAAKMSELLASYFRYNISNVDKMVTVEDELENIKIYFRIQKFRFDDRIDLHIQTDPLSDEIKRCKIPKIILQPIVENAILHGLEPQLKRGIITIRFMLYETRLVIVVSDTGIGMSAAAVADLNEKIQVSSSHLLRNESIGIINVNRRLKLIFGDDFGLRYFSKEDAGTDVEISIPFVKVEAN